MKITQDNLLFLATIFTGMALGMAITNLILVFGK